MYDSSSDSPFYNSKAMEFCDRAADMEAKGDYTSSASGSSLDTSCQQTYVNVNEGNQESAVEADEYAGQSSGGVGVVSDMAQRFQWWMAAVAAAVVMALVAIVLGQKKENREKRQQDGAVLSGAVGRRLNAVSAFADGVLPVRNRTNNVNAAGEQVEMSGYKLDNDNDAASSRTGSSRGSDEENASLGGYESAYA